MVTDNYQEPQSELVTPQIPYSQIPNALWDREKTDENTYGEFLIPEITSPYELLVLAYLMRLGNQGHRIFPSFTTIADRCRISRRTVIRTINALTEKGLIIKERLTYESNRYTVNLSVSDDKISAPRALPSATQTLPSATQAPYKEPLINNHYNNNENGQSANAELPLLTTDKEIKTDLQTAEPDKLRLHYANTVYRYYCDKYREKLGSPHPTLKADQRRAVYAAIVDNDQRLGLGGLDSWRLLINAHFERDGFNTDFNINHFVTGMVVELLYYECLY